MKLLFDGFPRQMAHVLSGSSDEPVDAESGLGGDTGGETFLETNFGVAGDDDLVVADAAIEVPLTAVTGVAAGIEGAPL